jgi:hypothetical protein
MPPSRSFPPAHRFPDVLTVVAGLVPTINETDSQKTDPQQTVWRRLRENS